MSGTSEKKMRSYLLSNMLVYFPCYIPILVGSPISVVSMEHLAKFQTINFTEQLAYIIEKRATPLYLHIYHDLSSGLIFM